MIRLCLDTTGYSRLMRGHDRLRERLEAADEVLLPVTVLGELYAGFQGGQVALAKVYALGQRTGVRTFTNQRCWLVPLIYQEPDQMLACFAGGTGDKDVHAHRAVLNVE